MYQLLPIIIACLLLILSVAAASLGIAEVYRNEATAYIETWELDADIEALEPPAWVWEQQHRYLWFANQLSPYDPNILSDLGKLYELRVDNISGYEANLVKDVNKAFVYYYRAVQLRPAWPYAWVDYMSLKISQSQIDEEFAYAMDRAAVLGPWQMVVQTSIAAGGLSIWADLPVELQDRVETTITRGLQNNTRLMQMLAEQFELYE